MDITQAKATIETILNNILTSSPDAITYLEQILTSTKNGVGLVGGVATLISQHPAIMQFAQKLLYLLNSGISVHEITIPLIQIATNLGLSLELVIQFLQILSGMIVMF